MEIVYRAVRPILRRSPIALPGVARISRSIGSNKLPHPLSKPLRRLSPVVKGIQPYRRLVHSSNGKGPLIVQPECSRPMVSVIQMTVPRHFLRGKCPTAAGSGRQVGSGGGVGRGGRGGEGDVL